MAGNRPSGQECRVLGALNPLPLLVNVSILGFRGPRDTNCGFPLTIFRRELSQRNGRAGCEERSLSSPTAGVGRKRPPQPGKKRPPQSKEKWRRRFRVNLRSRPGTCAVPSRPSERTLRVGAPGSHHARGAVGGAVASRWRPRTFGHLKITVIKKEKSPGRASRAWLPAKPGSARQPPCPARSILAVCPTTRASKVHGGPEEAA